MRGIRTSTRICSLFLATTLLLSACGGSPTATDAQSGVAGDGDVAAELDALYKQLDGLNRDQRRAKLIELAKAKGPIHLYSSTNPDDAAVLFPAFEKSTGVKLIQYRLDATAARTRLLQEAQANHRGADVVGIDATEMVLLQQAGLLLPVRSPYAEDVPKEVVTDYYVSDSYNVYITAWNTKKVPPEKAPKTWEDVLNFNGNVGIEIGDYAWFATLVKDYFVKQRGMTEGAAVDLFRKAAARSVPVDGHTLMAELLTAGEFDVAASAYHHSLTSKMEDGAPLEWRVPQAVEPVIVRAGGDGIPKTADNLPGALLYIEWGLSKEGQELLAQLNRTPATKGAVGGLPQDIEQLPVNLDIFTNEQERDKWRDLYEDVVRQTGKPAKSE